VPASISRARLVPEIVAPIMGALLLAVFGLALFLVMRIKRRAKSERLREQEMEERRPLGADPERETDIIGVAKRRDGRDGSQGVWVFVPSRLNVDQDVARNQIHKDGQDVKEPPPAYTQVAGTTEGENLEK
jgi:hypothetical protein